MNTNINGNGNKNVQEAINTLLEMFKKGNLEVVVRAVFKSDKIPSDNWSFLNRLLMYLNNTEDARGYKQWLKVRRHVKAGSKALYILAPVIVKKEKTIEMINDFGEKTEEKKLVEALVGFRGVPVFRYEDTEGEPIVRPENNVNIPYEFNGILHDLGLNVLPVGFKDGIYGAYNPYSKVIKLASPEIEVFLHELAHAVDDKIMNGLKPGQKTDQEVIAEFSAATIGYLLGYKMPFGNMLDYIKSYNFQEIFKCMARIEKVVDYVVKATQVQKAT